MADLDDLERLQPGLITDDHRSVRVDVSEPNGRVFGVGVGL